MTEQQKELLELHKKIGHLTGTLKGILWWDIPEELQQKIKEILSDYE